MAAGQVFQQQIEDKANFSDEELGVCVIVINMDFKRTSNSLCFKVQSVALNSPGSLQNSLSLFAVTPSSETGRFI